MIQDFRGKLAFALMVFVARQLRASEDALPDVVAADQASPPFTGGEVFTPLELAAWEGATEEEEVRVGPIRVRVRPGTARPSPLAPRIGGSPVGGHRTAIPQLAPA